MNWCVVCIVYEIFYISNSVSYPVKNSLRHNRVSRKQSKLIILSPQYVMSA